MRIRTRSFLLTAVALWMAGISLLHLTLNVGWGSVASKVGGLFKRQEATLWVGYLPVT